MDIQNFDLIENAILHNLAPVQIGHQEAILAKANGFRATGVLTFYIDSGIYAALRTYGEENLLGIIPKHFNAAARKIICELKQELVQY
ncbi:unnamed protein product [Rotaria socialis]|uniref:Uncharacterized protein n=1 Tax=Rotaria socialis TaxID=392032 RepID=A0A820SR02_9BILA|nr:unnamed protein product [Rotaria socialis]